MMFDVGILGKYNNDNWGGSLTTLATYATVTNLGFKARMLKLKGHDDGKDVIYNRLCKFTNVFADNPYPPEDWNKYFSNFLLCSDWTLRKDWHLPINIRTFTWVKDNINKISISASFGTETGAYEEKDYPWISSSLQRFQYLSLREKFSLDLCEKMGVNNAVIMPDPIFSQGSKFYYEIAHAYKHEKIDNKYVAVYLLDMPERNINLAIEIAEKLGLEPVFIIAIKDKSALSNKRLGEYKCVYSENLSESLSAWIYCLYYADAVITNSFHGACLGYIFEKDVFVVDRGMFAARLVDLLQQFNIKNRFICSADDVELAIKEQVDNKRIKININMMSKKVRKYLSETIEEGIRKSNRIDILPKAECTGCMSCANICPQKCIAIKEDEETGFLYPEVNELSCVNCGLCGKACPVISKKDLPSQSNNVYCGFSKDEKIRYFSTSGGFFTELANGVLDKGNAVVFGAAYDTPYRVIHKEVLEYKDITQIRQSKYVQSEIRETYLRMEQYLREGRNVLFCGTPCQCAAVRSFMEVKKVPHEKLYLIDFICHSVNSPKAYRAYLNEIEKASGDTIKNVWFKNKEDSWENFSTRIDFKTNQPYYKKNRYEDYFYKGFLNHNLYSRPSCSQCKFKGENRHSDITLADAWGISMSCDNRDGISTAIVHTDKGQKLFDAIRKRVYIEKKTLQEVSNGNVNFMHSTSLSAKSKYFYQRINQGVPFSKIIDEIEADNNYNEKNDNDKNNFSKVLTNGAIIHAHSKAQIIIKPNASLELNFGKLPGSNSDCLIELSEGAKIIVEGNFKIYHSCRIHVHENAVLTLGNGYLNTNSIIGCVKSITIGDAIIAPNCYIVDSDFHSIVDKGIVVNPPMPVKFEGHVWLGQNVTVLKGVNIGYGSCIGAKSLVNKDIPANSLAIGVPAKVIRSNVNWS